MHTCNLLVIAIIAIIVALIESSSLSRKQNCGMAALLCAEVVPGAPINNQEAKDLVKKVCEKYGGVRSCMKESALGSNCEDEDWKLFEVAERVCANPDELMNHVDCVYSIFNAPNATLIGNEFDQCIKSDLGQDMKNYNGSLKAIYSNCTIVRPIRKCGKDVVEVMCPNAETNLIDFVYNSISNVYFPDRGTCEQEE